MNSKRHNRRNDPILILCGAIFIIVAVVLMVMFFTQGETTVTGSNGSVEVTQSMVCEKDKYTYPFFDLGSADKGSIKINIILDDKKVDTISLVYNFYDSNTKNIERDTTNMHIAMNKSFSESNLGTDALNAAYASLPDSAQMSLYAETKELNTITAKYFLLESASGHFEKETVKKIYMSKGFKCTATE